MSERFPKHDYETEDDNRLKDIKSKISSLKAVILSFYVKIIFQILPILDMKSENTPLLDKMVWLPLLIIRLFIF